MYGVSKAGWNGGLVSEDNSPLGCNGASRTLLTEVLMLVIHLLQARLCDVATLLV